MSMESKKRMDAVITWVDGSDPAHQAKMAPFLSSSTQKNHSAAATRFANCGEIEFCVMSLVRFAPWVETIYIVTDDQQPAFLASIKDPALRQRISVIDHRQLFKGYEFALPVFNSLAIEAMLWNIPGLSDDFIYLNDDMMLTKPTPIEAFRTDEHYVLKGNMKPRKSKLWWYQLKRLFTKDESASRLNYWQVQEKSAATISDSRNYLDLPHCPHVLNRSTLKLFFERNPDKLVQTISCKFRDSKQLWSVSLFVHSVLASGQAKINNYFKSINIKADKYNREKIAVLLDRAEHQADHYFIVIQSLDMATPDNRDFILRWLRRIVRKEG